MVESVITAEDQAWFHQPVDIQVEQDNRAWLDTMLEMKRDELISYGIFSYALPQAAAEAVERNDLIAMIVTANRAGTVAATGGQQYRYIKELDGILEPAVAKFDEKSDPLYLTRGQEPAIQVYDKLKNAWIPMNSLISEAQKAIQTKKEAARAAAQTVADHIVPAAPAAPVLPTLSDAVIDVIQTAKLRREDLAKFAGELQIENPNDLEQFPKNDDLVKRIIEVNNVNRNL